MVKMNKFGRNVKIVAVIGIILVLSSAFVMLVRTYERYGQNYIEVEDGKVDIVNFDNIVSNPLILNGEWKAYDNIYIENEEMLSQLNKYVDNQYIRKLPEADLNEVSIARTYKLHIYGELSSDDLNYLAVGIPLASDKIRVYLNGKQIESYEPIKSWLGSTLNTQMYLIEDVYDNKAVYQELIISVPQSYMSGLYRRQISISRVNTYLQQMSTIEAVQNFMIGLMVLSILIGLIYIAIHPSYSVLTFMNLYDICKMLYILFLISDLPMMTYNAIFPGYYGEAFIRGVGIMFYFLAALFLNQLSQVTFDPNKVIHRFFLDVTNVMWVTGAILYLLKPNYFTNKAILATMIIFVVTLVGNFLRVRVCYMEDRLGAYEKFVMVKTMLLGSVVFLDLVTLNVYPRNNALLVTCYSLFFMIHFFVRGFVYRKPFMKLASYNEELEMAVEHRTKELQELNHNLKNLTIRDPLTNAFNRLYFEQNLDRLIEENNHTIHLCVFDLDNFKSINDTFGHQVGDDQLIDVIEVAKVYLPEGVIVSRIGGEEFTMLFIDYDDPTTLLNVENVRQELGKRAVVDGRTTGSFGIAKFVQGDTRKSLFVKADACLYQAKENGKNRIEYVFTK